MSSPWLIALLTYLFGSIPFGYLIVMWTRRGDVRKQGSGNIGAANVARTAGSVAGLMTLVLDASKGYLAVWLAGRWSGGNIRWIMLGAVFAVLGHLFPVWLSFRGGKGVATGLGVFLPICAKAVAAGFILWLLVVLFWRYVSLGSVVAAAALPVLIYLLYAPPHAPPEPVSFGAILISLLVIWKHRENMQRVIAGTESRFKLRR